MKLNRLKYVTDIFRQYVTFDSINFKSLNFTTQGVLIEPDFVSKFYIHFDVCLFLTRE